MMIRNLIQYDWIYFYWFCIFHQVKSNFNWASQKSRVWKSIVKNVHFVIIFMWIFKVGTTTLLTYRHKFSQLKFACSTLIVLRGDTQLEWNTHRILSRSSLGSVLQPKVKMPQSYQGKKITHKYFPDNKKRLQLQNCASGHHLVSLCL